MPSTTEKRTARSKFSFSGGFKTNVEEVSPSSAEVVTLKPILNLEELKLAFDRRFPAEQLRDVEYELVPLGLALMVHSVVEAEDFHRTYLWKEGDFDEMFSKPSHHDAKTATK